MNKFLSLPEKHRRDAMMQTAAKLNMEPAAVEKDFLGVLDVATPVSIGACGVDYFQRRNQSF